MSQNFDSICTWVLRQEDSTLAGKVINLMDGQGLTRYGIGQHSHPELPPDFYTTDSATALEVAFSVYRNIYWNRFCGDQILSDDVASCLLSFSINDGLRREIILLQRVLGFSAANIDGIMGPVTLQVTNAYDGKTLAASLRAAQVDWYHSIIQGQPTDARFLAGWLKRANLVYPSLT